MRIGDFAATAGLTARTIRFYEHAGLLPTPPRTNTGYRDYPGEATARLGFIRDAQAAGLTLAEIRSILTIADTGQPPCEHVTVLIHTHLDQIQQRITELEAARTALTSLAHRAAATIPADCTGPGICRILTPPAPGPHPPRKTARPASRQNG